MFIFFEKALILKLQAKECLYDQGIDFVIKLEEFGDDFKTRI